jgi:tetratricopeptide (TPR) repeat protein
LAEALVAQHPRHPEVRFLASEASLATRDPEGALEHIRTAVELVPDEPTLLGKLADNYIMLRRRLDAKAIAARLADLPVRDGAALLVAGSIYSRCDDPASALATYERALAAGVATPELFYSLALAQHFMGDAASAEANLERLFALTPNTDHAIYLRSTLRRQTPQSNHLPDLERRLADPRTRGLARVRSLYAMAKELEDLGEDARSFAALNEGAALRRAQLAAFDPKAEIEAIDAVRQAYSAEAMADGAPGHDEEGPIFVVGMPRTGTTLVERILARHPDVGSAGELLDFGQVLAEETRRARARHPELGPAEASLAVDFAALGREYLRGAREAAPQGRFFVDKMPVNYIYCGLILKALPNARIVHLVRDPMDCGYAVYKTLFNQAYPFSYDLREIADYYAAYDRMMRHWHQVVPGKILDVRYEDLVADPEGQARRLLAGCGLEWDDRVLDAASDAQPSTTASAAQVREPIHSRSVSKWRAHAAGLEPLRQRLAELGVLPAD